MYRVAFKYINSFLQSFAACRRGNTAIIFALVFPALFLLVGGGIEYGKVLNQKSKLQQYADSAALAAAKELSLAQGDDARIVAVARSVVDAALRSTKAVKGTADFMLSDIKVDVKIDEENKAVKVHLTQATIKDFPINGFEIETVSVEAEARVVGSLNVCVVTLDESSNKAIFLENEARLTGRGCAVYANSTHAQAITSGDSAMMTASLICSAGGKVGGKGNYNPLPMTDCPIFDDPLSERPAPDIGACDYGSNSEKDKSVKLAKNINTTLKGKIKIDSDSFTGIVVENDTVHLQPGTYCGGLLILGSSQVNFASGTYIMKGGPLLILDESTVIGEHVGFYFTGINAVFNFAPNTDIDLSAPRDGVMAGLLFFENRGASNKGIHAILSNSARNLLGTIYLHNSTLLVDANAPVAQESAYTAVVVRKLNLRAGPHFILNTRYDETDVPVPENIQGLASNIRLTK
ncbi:MAG: pilus assembly protein [Hyphomicrobiaceae bacterium]|nr:pilus assembly protein [Hyphomicrobiaceae bacterium]